MDVCSSLIVIENLCGVITKDNTLMTDDNAAAAAAPMLAWVSQRLLAETIICSSETLCPGRGLTGECQERPCPIKEHSCSSVNAHFRHWLSEKADKLHSEVSDFFLFFSLQPLFLSFCDTRLPICPPLLVSHYFKWNAECASHILMNYRAYLREGG